MAQTQIVFTTPFRRRARRVERELQEALDSPGSTPTRYRVPFWARGVRVEHAGWFNWAVVATDHRGH